MMIVYVLTVFFDACNSLEPDNDDRYSIGYDGLFAQQVLVAKLLVVLVSSYV